MNITNHLLHLPEMYESERSRSWIKMAGSILTGRICVDWKSNLLNVSTVYLIISSAYFFFSGYWLTALVHFSLGSFLGMIRKEIKDFTNLHNATDAYQKQINNQRTENAAFSRSNRRLEGNLDRMDQQLNKSEKNNAWYTENNKIFADLTAKLAIEAKESREEIRAINREFIEKTVEELERRRAAADLVHEQIVTSSSENQKEMKQLLKDALKNVDEMNNGYLKKMDERVKDLKTVTADLTAKKEEHKRISQEVDRLEQVRKGLEAANKTLEATNKKIEASTDALYAAAKKRGSKSQTSYSIPFIG